jgi:hypothetical protein
MRKPVSPGHSSAIGKFVIVKATVTWRMRKLKTTRIHGKIYKDMNKTLLLAFPSIEE